MSLINQVLHQLERRGAHTAPQTSVRAVPPRPETRWGRGLLLALLLLVMGLALWLPGGRQDRQGKIETVGSITPVRTTAAVSSPAAASAEPVTPASRMTLELSMLPLPDALRPKSEPVAPPVSLVKGMAPEAAPVPAPAPKSEPRPRPAAPVAESRSAPPLKKISPQQKADAEYHKGLQARQTGRLPEAIAAFESALKTDEGHEQARLALAALLLDNGQGPAAERVLQAGLALSPLKLSFAMVLARMQVDRDELAPAVATLKAYLPQADNNADYQAFYAALLQRQQRHKEAASHYQTALQMQPRNGVWLVGQAISLQALERAEDARSAYGQALATRTLSPALSTFVQQRLKEMDAGASPRTSPAR